ncbi:MAG: DUF1810 domain-containing protein [Firmicutes bacterium]|nr:DUF1810 domain-containing protein [Bacillota bacterium]
MGLERFLEAQERSYKTALSEIRYGQKMSHWMWYIFPQLKGLGYSSTAKYYGIEGREEAEAYLAHPVLGQRLREISGELLKLESCDAGYVMGYPDDLKLKSSMTLFLEVGGETVFQQVLDKFFDGEKDRKTLELL